ncbi:MAG TPA: hypothetical protein PKN62_01010 [bacterium]|nr:hypothetical protein [bacterium]
MNILSLLRWLVFCCCRLRKKPNAQAIVDISRYFAEEISNLLANQVDNYCWWSEWYRLMGLGQLNLCGLDFIKAKKGCWNIPISKGLTLKRVMTAVERYFPIASINMEKIDSLEVIEDVRTTNNKSYLISLCPKELISKNISMTLLERMLLELFLWTTKGQHIDRSSTMSCCYGSVYQGKFLDVYWSQLLKGLVVDKV